MAAVTSRENALYVSNSLLSQWQMVSVSNFTASWYQFKELRHDILSHFFDGLKHGLSARKPKTNGLLIKEKTKGVILKQKGMRMAEDGDD